MKVLAFVLLAIVLFTAPAQATHPVAVQVSYQPQFAFDYSYSRAFLAPALVYYQQQSFYYAAPLQFSAPLRFERSFYYDRGFFPSRTIDFIGGRRVVIFP